MATVSVEAVQHKLQTSGIQLEQHSGNMFSPDQKSSDGRGAPATPGCAAATNALKRPLSTEDDEPGQHHSAVALQAHTRQKPPQPVHEYEQAMWCHAEAAPSEPDDDKPQQKPSRQYAKWSAEEEQIFFLKLQTVSSLELTEGLRSIAQHLPSKSSSQVIAPTTVCTHKH